VSEFPEDTDETAQPQTFNPTELQSVGALEYSDLVLPAPRIDRLLTGVGDLCKILKALRKRAHMPKEDIWYSDKIYYLQRHILDIAHSSDYPQPLDSVCALAALIYCGHCLRDIPLTFTAVRNGVTRLKAAIETYEREYSWTQDGDLARKMFWILSFGGVCAEGKLEGEWFATKFCVCSGQLQLKDWIDAKEILDNILWQPELDEGGFRLWTEAKHMGIGVLNNL
jgi:hypothetical protein